MLKHLGLDGWQAWDYAVARLYKRAETEEGISNMCDVCGSPNGNEHGMTCPIAIAEALMIRELRKCQAGHRKPVVYVAGRFRAADGWKINENVFAAEKAGRAVAALGAMPLIPHSIGAHMAGTEDDSFWLTGTLELMRRCDVVLVLPGYQESQGTKGEIAEAQRIGMPVIMPLDGAPGWEDLRSWLKLSMLAQGEGPVMLMAEIAEKRLVDARGKADQTLARLGIELGQREGETLLAAAQRVRETGIHAEVVSSLAELRAEEAKAAQTVVDRLIDARVARMTAAIELKPVPASVQSLVSALPIKVKPRSKRGGGTMARARTT